MWNGFPSNPCIPLSKSFLIWRFLHNRLSTDENLARRGFAISSMCSLCSKSSETSSHIFFDCNFVTPIWRWFFDQFNIHRPLGCFLDCKLAMKIECFAGNQTNKASNSSIENFYILKKLDISIHPSMVKKIINILWQPPNRGWIKCDIDKFALGVPSICSWWGGGIFINEVANHVVSFANFLGHGNPLLAKLTVVMKVVKHVREHKWDIYGSNLILLML
ncbi:hypothetical protein KIW84_063689 [Lathyrus oleraceus]|uniref:Reverse transcriptase zinc-binding domain-containing protein n=1 Tax=Pisum sativum TaxID=3888 RepID=A0A9D5A9Y8_PEA|nr:hypothetical protein KIW84_063689 [Pisum sativum]